MAASPPDKRLAALRAASSFLAALACGSYPLVAGDAEGSRWTFLGMVTLPVALAAGLASLAIARLFPRTPRSLYVALVVLASLLSWPIVHLAKDPALLFVDPWGTVLAVGALAFAGLAFGLPVIAVGAAGLYLVDWLLCRRAS